MTSDIKQQNIIVPKLWQRELAFIIDCFFCGLLMYVLAFIFGVDINNSENWSSFLIFFIYFFGYFLSCFYCFFLLN
jgi:uncharacterized RDD family membrane protein YckC